MEFHVSDPPPGDGAFELVDLPDPPRPAPAPALPQTAPTDEIPSLPAVLNVELVPEPRPEAPAAGAEGRAAEVGPRLRRKRRAARRRWDAPAWVVSALIHVGILGTLAAMATTAGEVIRRLPDLDTSLGRPDAAEELTKIYAEPSDAARELTVGDTSSETSGPGFATSIGAAPPSSTPRVAKTGRAFSEKSGLPSIPAISAPSGLQMMPSMPTRDLGGGGKVGGDVAFAAGDVGVALDQVAREILRHLTQHKVTVVWLFDESESMRDDQKEIRKKFDRVVNELKVNAPDEPAASKGKKRSNVPPLTHAIVGYGGDIHYEQDTPTADIEQIGRAIDHLRIDTTGRENTMGAVRDVIGHYGSRITQERKVLIVLVTDESGDDGDGIEEARQAAVSREVPVYIIGRQSLFGHGRLTINYIDPVTKDNYWVHIRRGPETADVETLQWDGIHTRWDEQPSGFAPYELARLAKDTGGIYFLLPSEEELRIRHREKAYSITTLKEYVPDYESRLAYSERRTKSEFRRTLYDIIQETRKYPFRHAYSVIPELLLSQIEEDLPVVTERLNVLIAVEKRLRELEKLRNREPEKRWQAAYDLMLAQIVAYQIKAYEYRATLLEMQANPPRPKDMPSAELTVQWWLNHSHERKAPKEKTEKVYAEAIRLFELVKERHPNTPWADLADDEIRRGFSVHRAEWRHKHTARYEERRKLVPNF